MYKYKIHLESARTRCSTWAHFVQHELGAGLGFSAECVCGVIPIMLTGFVLLLPLEGRELSTFNWRNRHKI